MKPQYTFPPEDTSPKTTAFDEFITQLNDAALMYYELSAELERKLNLIMRNNEISNAIEKTQEPTHPNCLIEELNNCLVPILNSNKRLQKCLLHLDRIV